MTRTTEKDISDRRRICKVGGLTVNSICNAIRIGLCTESVAIIVKVLITLDMSHPTIVTRLRTHPRTNLSSPTSRICSLSKAKSRITNDELA